MFIFMIIISFYCSFYYGNDFKALMIYFKKREPAHWPSGFANGLEDLGSILHRIIPKTLKMILDTSFLNTQQYKVCIKGKVEQSRERSSVLPYISV